MSANPPVDHFAALGAPRRPWLDPDQLKERFRRVTSESHPDLGGDTERFASANAAQRTLRQPSLRLKHLLELEFPETAKQPAMPISPALSERFMEMATLRREAAAFANQEAAATTPVGKALLASERFMMQRDIQKALGELETLYEERLQAVRDVDGKWETNGKETGPLLAALQQELAYLEKWIGQLRELLVG
jgi:hypothetical protein